MPVNGIILESYARSAGTGDQAVAGVVTARRSGNRHERQIAARKRQEEEEKDKKQKIAQEQIAKILAHKWAEEDRKKDTRKRRDEEEQRHKDDSSDEEEEEERRRPRKREGESQAKARREQPEEEKKEDEVDDEEGGDRVAGWVTYERSKPGPPPPSVKEEAQERLDVARPKAGTVVLGDSRSSQQGRRFTETSGAGHSRSVGDAFEGQQRGKSVVRGRAEDTANKAHSKKVANVFGFGMEEEDEDDAKARREMELAARSKRAKLSSLADATEAIGDGGAHWKDSSPAIASSSTEIGSTGGGKPMDMCTYLMKMAKWKRDCGGKRLPMPKELEAEVAKAMGGNGPPPR